MRNSCLFGVVPPPQIYNSVADLQFNGTEKPKAKSLLQVKVILNPGLLHSSELHCCTLLVARAAVLQRCSAVAIPGQIQEGKDLLFFAEVLRTAFGTTKAAGIFVLTLADK